MPPWLSHFNKLETDDSSYVHWLTGAIASAPHAAKEVFKIEQGFAEMASMSVCRPGYYRPKTFVFNEWHR